MLETTIALCQEPAVASIEAPHERLVALLRQEMTRVSREPRRTRVFFEFWSAGLCDPVIGTRMKRALDRYREVFQPLAEAVLVENREFLPDVTPRWACGSHCELHHGLLSSIAHRTQTRPRRFRQRRRGSSFRQRRSSESHRVDLQRVSLARHPTRIPHALFICEPSEYCTISRGPTRHFVNWRNSSACDCHPHIGTRRHSLRSHELVPIRCAASFD